MGASISEWDIFRNITVSAVASAFGLFVWSAIIGGVLFWCVLKPIGVIGKLLRLENAFKNLEKTKFVKKLDKILNSLLKNFPARVGDRFMSALVFLPIWLPVFLYLKNTAKADYGVGGEIGSILGMSALLLFFFSQTSRF